MTNNDIEKLEQLTQQLPDNAKLHLALGKAYLAVGKLDKAKDELNSALGIDPSSPEVFLKLGNVLAENKNFEEAIENYKKALALDSYYVEALYCLGMAYVDQGQGEEVEKILKRLEQLHPIWAQGLKSYYSKIL